MNKNAEPELVSNRKAFHHYEILETFEAGIALVGTEVKSLRTHHGSLQEAYIQIQEGELWLLHSSIPPYSHGNIYNHEEKRKRKLLLHRNEIQKLRKLVQEKGIALIPLRIYLKRGKIKVQIACAKGKKAYDKREKIKEKEQKEAMQRAQKRQDS